MIDLTGDLRDSSPESEEEEINIETPLPRVASSSVTQNMCVGCGQCCSCNSTLTHPAKHKVCIAGLTVLGKPTHSHIKSYNKTNISPHPPLTVPVVLSVTKDTNRDRVVSFMQDTRPFDPFTLGVTTAKVIICQLCKDKYDSHIHLHRMFVLV
jgi:hypothetical protein